MTHQTECAGVLLINQDGNIIAQHRDDIPTIYSPGKASFFGGRIESDDETPLHAAVREMNEETNLRLTAVDLQPWMEYNCVLADGLLEHEYIFIAHGITTDGLEVYEGQGYHIVKSADDPLLAEIMKPAAKKWFAERAQ